MNILFFYLIKHRIVTFYSFYVITSIIMNRSTCVYNDFKLHDLSSNFHCWQFHLNLSSLKSSSLINKSRLFLSVRQMDERDDWLMDWLIDWLMIDWWLIDWLMIDDRSILPSIHPSIQIIYLYTKRLNNSIYALKRIPPPPLTAHSYSQTIRDWESHSALLFTHSLLCAVLQ